MVTRFERGYALLIGIANYKHVSKLPALVLKDAQDVAKLLLDENYCGYSPSNVKILLDNDATSARIRDGLQWLADSTGPNDTVVNYFSGHGGRIEAGQDAGTYLIPYECEPSRIKETAIRSDEFALLLSKIRAQKLVVLLDACHSAGAGEVKALDPSKELKAGLDESSYSELAKGAGRVIMASSRATEVSLILPGESNSLFTRHLLDALRGNAPTHGDGKVCVFDVFHYVSDKVPMDAPKQHPVFKAHGVESNFPLALYQGGKEVSRETTTHFVRPSVLSGPARVTLCRRLVDRWEELATYFDIPPADQAKFKHGDEPRSLLQWLDQRERTSELRDAFNFLGWDDLIEELNQEHNEEATYVHDRDAIGATIEAQSSREEGFADAERSASCNEPALLIADQIHIPGARDQGHSLSSRGPVRRRGRKAVALATAILVALVKGGVRFHFVLVV